MKKGFTFIELLIVMVITSIVGMAIFSASKYLSYNMKGTNFKTQLLKDAHTAMAYLTKDIGYAVTLDNTYLKTLGLGYENAANRLSVRIPSVDSAGEPILDAGYNFIYYDYIHFYKEGNQIKKITLVDPNSIATYSSSRTDDHNKIYVIADNVQTLTFTDNTGGTHPPATIGEIITGLVTDTLGNTIDTEPEITDYIEEISKVGITVVFFKKMPAGHYGEEVTKTLITQVFALRNKA